MGLDRLPGSVLGVVILSGTFAALGLFAVVETAVLRFLS